MSPDERRPRAVVVRDPIWNGIRLDPVAARIVESGAFQRLRYIRQLGLAHLVYPGATHTRFDHALGVYHLARRALDLLDGTGGLREVPDDEPVLVSLAALLHDIGHYPYSHALEELEAGDIPGHHEAVAGRFLADPDVRNALESVAPDGPERIHALIRGESESPLQGLVSGSLDLDKIEYLRRDARFCGVPYGEVDVDRLVHNLVLLEDPETGRVEVGVHEKGVAALESLLFSKYQMFRNVYWHHAVRAATAMYKRIVSDALRARMIGADELVGQTDERLLGLLEARAAEGVRRAGAAAAVESAVRAPAGGGRAADGASDGAVAERVARWIDGLRQRRLPKRATEVVAAELDADGPGDWLATDSPLKRRVEDRLAAELGLEAGAVFLDYPEKSAMFDLNLLVQRRSGETVRVGAGGRAGLIRLPQVAEELYQTARVLRLFTLGGRREVDPRELVRVVSLPADALADRLEDPTPLLGRARR